MNISRERLLARREIIEELFDALCQTPRVMATQTNADGDIIRRDLAMFRSDVAEILRVANGGERPRWKEER